MCCKTAIKTLIPVAFILNTVRSSYNVPDDVQCKQLHAWPWPWFRAVYTAAGVPPYKGSLSSQPPA